MTENRQTPEPPPPAGDPHGRGVRRAEPVNINAGPSFCPKCRAELKPGVKFCSKCGMHIRIQRRGALSSMGRKTRHYIRSTVTGLREWTDIRNVLILYCVMLCGSCLAALISPSRIVHMFVHDMMFILIVLVAMLFTLDVVKSPLSKAGFPLWAYVTVGLGCMVTFGAMASFSTFLSWVFGLPDSDALTGIFKDSGFGLFVAIVSVAVVPGIFEEVAFRGIIQGTLARHMKPRTTILLSGILFGIIHIQFLNFPLFLLGIYLAWLRHRSGSLYPCILAHFCHNAIVVVIEWYR